MAKYKTFFEKFIIGLTFIFLVYYTLFSAVLAVYSAIDLYDEYKFNNWSSSFIDSPAPVSYTHLDVYKRQAPYFYRNTERFFIYRS